MGSMLPYIAAPWIRHGIWFAGRKSSAFQALDSFAKKLRAPEPTGFPRLKAVSPEVEAGIIWCSFTEKICTSSSDSVRFCQIGYTYWLLSMIQDDPRWSRCSVPQCIPVQWIFSLLPLFPVNSARPQRLQLAVRYESWLDDKRLDVTPDLRLEIRNSNEFRIIRISWISKKS